MPLPDIGGPVAGLAEKLAKGRVGRVERWREGDVAGFVRKGQHQPALLAVEPGDQHAARRCAGGCSGVGPAELDASPPQRVHVRHETMQELADIIYAGWEDRGKA